jgi:hypothetical protein
MKYATSLRFLVQLFAAAGLEPLFFKGSVAAGTIQDFAFVIAMSISVPLGRYDETESVTALFNFAAVSPARTGSGDWSFAVGAPGARIVDLHSSRPVQLPSLEAVFARSG